jgi:4-hydroxy-2-oxoheptanedioate aldolase
VPVENPIRSRWSEGRPARGLFSTIPSVFAVELLARSGVDYVCVDLQHGAGDTESLGGLLMACWAGGAAPLVRPASGLSWQIGKALDLGAFGVIVPLISNAEEASAAVAATKYPPRGVRSYGPLRIAGILGSGLPEELENEALCFAMVENQEGLEHVEEIAQTPGLDGIYIGPSDLGVALGVGPRGYDDRVHVEATARIRGACESAGIVPAIHCLSSAQALQRAAEGFRLITIGTDTALLRDGAADAFSNSNSPAAPTA